MRRWIPVVRRWRDSRGWKDDLNPIFEATPFIQEWWSNLKLWNDEATPSYERMECWLQSDERKEWLPVMKVWNDSQLWKNGAIPGWIHSQWWGDGGSSLGWATVELAKLLNAADDGLMHKGTRFEFNWSWMNLCSFSFTLETHVSSDSQASGKDSSDTGSKSLVYCLSPAGVETQHAHMQEWYLSLPSSR